MNTRDIAQDCYLRIGANNGYYHRDYFITCVDDAIREALSALQAENARLKAELEQVKADPHFAGYHDVEKYYEALDDTP